MRVTSTPSGLVPPPVVSLVVFLVCVLHSWTTLIGSSFMSPPVLMGQFYGSPRMYHTYFVSSNRTKLNTRGGTCPDGVKTTLILHGEEIYTPGSKNRKLMCSRYYRVDTGMTRFTQMPVAGSNAALTSCAHLSITRLSSWNYLPLPISK